MKNKDMETKKYYTVNEVINWFENEEAINFVFTLSEIKDGRIFFTSYYNREYITISIDYCNTHSKRRLIDLLNERNPVLIIDCPLGSQTFTIK